MAPEFWREWTDFDRGLVCACVYMFVCGFVFVFSGFCSFVFRMRVNTDCAYVYIHVCVHVYACAYAFW